MILGSPMRKKAVQTIMFVSLVVSIHGRISFCENGAFQFSIQKNLGKKGAQNAGALAGTALGKKFKTSFRRTDGRAFLALYYFFTIRTAMTASSDDCASANTCNGAMEMKESFLPQPILFSAGAL
jgi:hypothetical protein